MKHLWEIEHPYYMTEGCYFNSECHQEYISWEDFISEWGDADPDYNWLIRWDWTKGEDGDDYNENILMIQFFLQRKAYPLSAKIYVRRRDEKKIIKYLQDKAEYMRKMWEPFL